MGVGALIFVLAEPLFHIIFAELGLVLDHLGLVLLVPELAVISLFALIFEEIPANSFSLQLKKVLHLVLAANIDPVAGRLVVENRKDGFLQLFRLKTPHKLQLYNQSLSNL